MISVMFLLPLALYLVILAAGGLIVWYAVASWRRTRSRPMLFLGIGLGSILLGTLFPGGVEVTTSSLPPTFDAVRLGLIAAGFVTILLGLHLRFASHATEPQSAPDTEVRALEGNRVSEPVPIAVPSVRKV